MAFDASDTFPRREAAYLIGLLGILTAIDAMSIDIYMPALPQLQRTFSISSAGAQATLSIFLAGLALGQAIYGPISDRYGRKPPLIGGLIIYVIGCIVPIAAPSFGFLMAGRLMQAIGASAGLVISRAIVADRFDQKSSARIYSRLMQILGLTVIVAPLVGGYLVAFSSWQWIFIVLCGLGIICLCAVSLTLEESHRVQRGGTTPLLAQSSDYLHLLLDRSFVALTLSMACATAGMFALLPGSAFIFVDLFQWTPAAYSTLYSVSTLGFVIAGALNGLVLRRHSPESIVYRALLTQLGLAFILCFVSIIGRASPGVIAALMVSLLSTQGFMLGNLTAVAMNRASRAAGAGSSLLGMAQFTFSALAAPLAASIGGSPLFSTSTTIVIFAILSLACFAIGTYFQRLQS